MAATEYLGVQAVADMLGMTPKAVYGLRDRGLLPPPVKLGNRIWWQRAVIEAWLAQHTETDRQVKSPAEEAADLTVALAELRARYRHLAQWRQQLAAELARTDLRVVAG